MCCKTIVKVSEANLASCYHVAYVAENERHVGAAKA